MRLRLTRLLAFAPLFGGCLCTPDPGPQPPDQPGDCEAGGSPGAEPGTGLDAFVELAENAETQLNYGAQGGMHVWVSVKATGFGGARVDLELTATDAFSGVVLGSGAAPQVQLNQLKNQPAGTCDYHGIPLFLNQRFSKSGGLATLEAKVTSPDGRTAHGEKRIWIGAAMPACVPGATPALVLRNASDYADAGLSPRELQDGDTLNAFQNGPGEPTLGIGAVTTGFAASALKLHGELRSPEAEPGAPALASADSVSSQWDPPASQTGESSPRCVPSQTVQLPVTADLEGKTVLLVVKADDQNGHVQELSRTVTLHRQLLSSP